MYYYSSIAFSPSRYYHNIKTYVYLYHFFIHIFFIYTDWNYFGFSFVHNMNWASILSQCGNQGVRCLLAKCSCFSGFTLIYNHIFFFSSFTPTFKSKEFKVKVGTFLEAFHKTDFNRLISTVSINQHNNYSWTFKFRLSSRCVAPSFFLCGISFALRRKWI